MIAIRQTIRPCSAFGPKGFTIRTIPYGEGMFQVYVSEYSSAGTKAEQRKAADAMRDAMRARIIDAVGG